MQLPLFYHLVFTKIIFVSGPDGASQIRLLVVVFFNGKEWKGEMKQTMKRKKKGREE